MAALRLRIIWTERTRQLRSATRSSCSSLIAITEATVDELDKPLDIK